LSLVQLPPAYGAGQADIDRPSPVDLNLCVPVLACSPSGNPSRL